MEATRKVDRGDPTVGRPVERGVDGVWPVRGHATGWVVRRSTVPTESGTVTIPPATWSTWR